MPISAVVCAYTMARWDQLVFAIESLERQEPAPEVILVCDHNDELLARAQETWPDITVLSNDGPRGLSGARNRALREASGEIVAFLDDDAWADDDWLGRLARPFDDPAVVAVGGAALPIWPGATSPVQPGAELPQRPGAEPAVVPPELRWVVGCTYRGQPTAIAEVRNVMGCSMAFRRVPLLAVGGFNPDTGRIGALPVGCEETEACIRLRQADPSRRILFEPLAVVHHHVSADRVRLRYVVRRSWCEGISKAAIARTVGAKDSLGVESGYVRTTIVRGILAGATQGPRGWAAASAMALSVLAAGAGFVRGSASDLLARRSRRDAGTARPVLGGADG